MIPWIFAHVTVMDLDSQAHNLEHLFWGNESHTGLYSASCLEGPWEPITRGMLSEGHWVEDLQKACLVFQRCLWSPGDQLPRDEVGRIAWENMPSKESNEQRTKRFVEAYSRAGQDVSMVQELAMSFQSGSDFRRSPQGERELIVIVKGVGN